MLAHPPGTGLYLPLDVGEEGAQQELGRVRAGQFRVLLGKSPLVRRRRTGTSGLVLSGSDY